MLQLNNRTPFACTMGLFPNPDGVDCAYGVLKATFELRQGKIAPAGQQPPPLATDQYWGDPLKTSIRLPSEVTLSRPGTDVLLIGQAHAPHGQVPQMDVALRVGPVHKTIRVFGNRVWRAGLLGHKASEPEPFATMPLRYEHAFGGTDPEPKDEKKIDYEPRNPIGRGLVARGSRRNAEGIPLPNLEDPANLIRSTSDRPAPACFAPVAPHWEPRKSYAGTYDQAWTKKRAPYLPKDFDPRFLQSAPADLMAAKYLQGGEPVEIVGASPKGPIQFALPVCSMEMIFHLDGKAQVHVPMLEMIVFEPEADRFWMVWRACQAVDKKMLRLSELEVVCAEYSRRMAG
jgi:hypothetical protein